MKRAAWNHSAGGAIVRKNPCNDVVDWLPKIDVGNGDVHLEDAIPVAAGGFKNCVDVVERLLGLFLDRFELLLKISRIDPKLARDEDEAVVDSCLRIMSGGLRRVRGIDSLDFHAA